jgi:hypothetical protein
MAVIQLAPSHAHIQQEVFFNISLNLAPRIAQLLLAEFINSCCFLEQANI